MEYLTTIVRNKYIFYRAIYIEVSLAAKATALSILSNVKSDLKAYGKLTGNVEAHIPRTGATTVVSCTTRAGGVPVERIHEEDSCVRVFLSAHAGQIAAT